MPMAVGRQNYVQRVTCPPPNTTRTLLGQSDFTYLGFYDVVDGLTAAGLGSGFTLRYVSGTFRGMYLRQGSLVYGAREFTLPGSFGGTCTLRTPLADIWNGNGMTGSRVGIRWDASLGKLWSTQAIDYPNIGTGQGNRTSSISTRAIDDSDVVSAWHGFWGFHNVGQRSVYGGVQKVPAWFASLYSTGGYMAGFGGYSSLMGQGLSPSLGPFFSFFADPHGVYTEEALSTQNGGISTSNYKIGADCRSGVSAIDYGTNYSGRSIDRGVRSTLTGVNWCDSSDSRGNPTTRPTYPTDRSGTSYWAVFPAGGTSPNDPNTFGRWTWGDSYNGSVVWIDNDAGTRTKQGIVAVATLQDGYAWYASSDIHFDDKEYEIHIYDPSKVGECINGTRAGYNVRPTVAFSIKSLLEGLPSGTGSGTSQQVRQIAGADFDSTTNTLYLALYGVPNGTNQSKMRLYAFSVGGS